MQSIHQDFSVEFSYDVHFTTGLFQPKNKLLTDAVADPEEPMPKKMVAVLDKGLLAHHEDLPDQIETYAKAHDDTLTLAASPIVVPGGEAAKNDPDLVNHIHQVIYETRLDRHAYVLAVGGGAVLDLAGYAAGTAHRGIRLIRVPTTVLSQNDSGVGVKNGINAFDTKNFLGTFEPPDAVLNDLSFLRTLDDRDWRAGISEAIKVGLLKDADFFNYLCDHASALAPPTRDLEAMTHVVYRCAELHLDHIATSGDPFEKGSSRPLDFGHWAAHKLEELTDYTLRHGEAVAIGIALDCAYSHLTGHLSSEALDRILDLTAALGFDLYVPEMDAHLDTPDHPDCLFQGLDSFREHLGGELTIMLLNAIGEGIEVHSVDRDRYRDAVALLRRQHAERVEQDLSETAS
ncbi:MAG TPA: 3-dehydroquinate synthase [Salinibacter sp.]|nr:3-dehydroquinate synthase [Salinibacter sp.]